MFRAAANVNLVALIFALITVAVMPVSADDLSRSDHRRSTLAYARSESHFSPFTQEFAAQRRRPRVTIYPRRVHPGPNAVRQCRSWLVREYRVSGPVIVPRMYCWWE